MRRPVLLLVTSILALAACRQGSDNETAPAVEPGPNASAEAASPKDVIEARQKNYKQIGKASKAIKDELGKPEPSLAVVEENAGRIAELAARIPAWFPAGTGPEAGVKTEAKAAIWEQKPRFDEGATKLATAARGVVDSAARGDAAATRTAANELTRTCKGCHDSYREKH